MGIEKHGFGDEFERDVIDGMRDDAITTFVKTSKWMMLFRRFYFAGKGRDPSKIVGTVKKYGLS